MDRIGNTAEPEQEADRFLAALYAPLPGMSPDRVTAETIEDEMSSFMAFSGAVNGWPSG